MRESDLEEEPASCDGCGRDSRTAGMLRTGWTVRPAQAGFAGCYCNRCAAALEAVSFTVQCTGCEREVDEDDADSHGWRYWPYGLAGLQPFCSDCTPDCAERSSSYFFARSRARDSVFRGI